MNFNQTNNNQGNVINKVPDSVIEKWQKGAILARAAPELYAALEEIVENGCVYHKDSMDMYSTAIENARAALAKARGEKTNDRGK